MKPLQTQERPSPKISPAGNAADRRIATRTFTFADQEAFARISGDRNPIHMDKRAARRTQAGAPVLHGIHGVLWALDCLGAEGTPMTRLASLKVQFPKFVYVDCEVSLRIARRDEHAIKAELTAEGMVVTVLELKFGPRQHGRPDEQGGPALSTQGTSPRVLALTDLEDLSGRLMPPETGELAARFPLLCAALGQERVAALTQLSTLVGMICPGLHSIFSGFTVSFTEGDGGPGLGWRTLKTDERFRIVWMHVHGHGVVGEVQAFLRPEPVEAPPMDDLAARVSAAEFASRTALVVGGSRGLGAATAKLLAAGGARIFVTYATGKAEADLLIDDVCAARGSVVAKALPCDVTGDIGAQLDGLPSSITHLYYFATPRIYRQSRRVFSRDRFDELLSVYVDGFSRVAGWLVSHCKASAISILYPSTTFVDDRPKGMTEYAMAKAAGEALARDLAAASGVSITTPRIPRVLTDQTATVVPLETADAVDIMLPLLRAERQ